MDKTQIDVKVEEVEDEDQEESPTMNEQKKSKGKQLKNITSISDQVNRRRNMRRQLNLL